MTIYMLLTASFLAALLMSAVVLTSARAVFRLKPLLRPVHWLLLAGIFYYDVGLLYGMSVRSMSEAALVIGLGLLLNPLGVVSGLIALWINRDEMNPSHTAVISTVLLILIAVAINIDLIARVVNSS